MASDDDKRNQFSLRSLCLIVLVVAVLCSVYPTYHAWRLAQIPFDRSQVNRIVVTGGRYWSDGQVTEVLTDPEQIVRVVTLMENSSPVGIECGGLEWVSVRFYDVDQELACIWVGDYAEWGYGGKTHGYSNDLQALVIKLLDRHSSASVGGGLATPVAR